MLSSPCLIVLCPDFALLCPTLVVPDSLYHTYLTYRILLVDPIPTPSFWPIFSFFLRLSTDFLSLFRSQTAYVILSVSTPLFSRLIISICISLTGGITFSVCHSHISYTPRREGQKGKGKETLTEEKGKSESERKNLQGKRRKGKSHRVLAHGPPHVITSASA